MKFVGNSCLISGMKKYNPTSPGRRSGEIVDYSMLTKKEPEKQLVFGFHRAQGRNNYGRITVRHKGGRVRALYRAVDFMYDKKDIPAVVEALEYDPNRSGFIALVKYQDGDRRYMLAPQNLAVGAKIIVSEKAPIETGSRTVLRNIPVGTFVYNIELLPGRGAVLVRSAGIGAQVLATEGNSTTLKQGFGKALQKTISINTGTGNPVLGSASYNQQIQNIVSQIGAREAFYQIMADVRTYGGQLDDFGSDNVA